MFAPVYGSYSNIAGKQEEIEMFDKLEDLLIRLEEILSELQEPDVASDPNRFRKLMKEQSELTPIVEAYKEYKACKQNIEESLELLNEESDEDMRELAKEELNESKARVEELEHELKILLLPKDPNDSNFFALYQFHFPAFTLCIMQIHTINFCSKKCCFISTGTSTDLNYYVLVIIRVFWNRWYEECYIYD